MGCVPRLFIGLILESRDFAKSLSYASSYPPKIGMQFGALL